MPTLWDVLLDAFLDTLKVFPFLLLIYILIEVLEHKTSFTKNRKILQGGFAPLIGSAAGVIPLCGFSVMAAKLYDNGFIRTGTLLAVFIATSDEALIIMLSDVSSAPAVLPLLLVKFVLAVAVGYAVNFVLRREKVVQTTEAGEHAYTCGHDHAVHKSDWSVFLGTPLLHSLKVGLYLLIVNIVFGVVVFFIGEDNVSSALVGNIYLQPLLTSAIGLIPSCASSVILTGAYVNGGIAFGSLLAGLITNAGMGFVILLKRPKKLPRTLALMLFVYVIAYLAGIAMNLLAPYLKL